MLLSLAAGVLAFLATALLIPHFIRFYQLKKIEGQQMHEDVKQHLDKAGTPTMGGTVFLVVSFIISILLTLLFLRGDNVDTNAVLGILLVILIYGAIGFFDDFLKIFKKRNEGLTARQKLILQILGGIIFYVLYMQGNGTNSLNVLGYHLPLGIFYVTFVLFWLVGFSNAVNLTDGIDGLSSISVVISLLTYSVIAFKQEQMGILLVIVAMIGSLLAFFIFNKKPAKIFMGDIGSLALGAMLAAISIALHQEWTLLLIGIVYVLETSSVMLQVAYFRWTKKRTGEGKRIFRMTPLHHHFELGGFTGRGNPWSEWRVDIVFWGIGLLAGLITLMMLYV
ncbi:phospho-N-acetylmuramoyl-pentapeptide-transferase [Streptococcus sp. CSL10205-OR2]|uniref:phospho-N-acetylmuramoyl-pentapeptide- transferase n=1 Tax=Streptococcus sp. CSL10205-OR2 TaxID=2980558 RepID=UPI0021DB3E51|nr:phospho-N-acetylmuramoyl-pentapeptide-transferase [Streptococcus sp. CSL10205-OR2]MCU9532962.1 phospho-N-acetylmuramoyl-pentapeptide-transferase [Streptococcus sp. CSL10205-OR2]